MNKRKHAITAHCLIRNEQNWIWYAINSVIDYVDQIFVFDTGSTDKTAAIIKSIKNPKIIFEEKGIVDKKHFTQLRAEMLERTTTPWFLILDGDEIWPEATITELVETIKNAPREKDTVVVGQWVCMGDVYHYSKELATCTMPITPSHLRGFRLSRALRKIPGLHCIGNYGYESYADKNKVNVSDWEITRKLFLSNKLFHMTFLPRSSSRSKDREVMMRGPKTHFVKGKAFPSDMYYPEVFNRERPLYVPSPWRHLRTSTQLKGLYYRAQNLIERIMNHQ